LEGTIMLLGALVPFHDTGGDPDTVREYVQPHRDAKHQRYRESRFQQEDQRLNLGDVIPEHLHD
jgi:hypothetical protein